MCGVAVVLGRSDAAGLVQHMIDMLAHRGDVTDPLFSPHPRLAACTRRLRIVDPACAVQPQPSSNGRIHVCLNGEIYNHEELRRELIALGSRFRTYSDTEVVATALQVWGAGAFRRFQGMFAIVAIDLRTGEWLAARDPLGVKPLYVIEDLAEGARLFCSEIRPLVSAVEVLDVYTLPPGHVLTPQGCFRYVPRWSDPNAFSAGGLTEALRTSVRERLPEGLPCAVLLSGGLDSSLVLHFAREARPEVQAFCVGEPGSPDFSFAADYADSLGVELTPVPLANDSASALADMRAAVHAMEAFEPETVRNGHCALAAAKATAGAGFRVALCGEGADELFAGYRPLELAYGAGQAEGDDVRAQCLETMHFTALQRVDRSGMRYGLELREPFLDAAVVRLALAYDREALVRAGPRGWVGKQPLRAVGRSCGLPEAILERVKAGFNEGCGFDGSPLNSPWIDLSEDWVSDQELAQGIREYDGFSVATKEELLYLKLLSEHIDVRRVAQLRVRAQIRMPQYAMLSDAIALGKVD